MIQLEEPYVFYNFHYYEPNVFTHQKAHFSEEFRTWNQTLAYPGDMTDYITFLDTHKEFKKGTSFDVKKIQSVMIKTDAETSFRRREIYGIFRL